MFSLFYSSLYGKFLPKPNPSSECGTCVRTSLGTMYKETEEPPPLFPRKRILFRMPILVQAPRPLADNLLLYHAVYRASANHRVEQALSHKIGLLVDFVLSRSGNLPGVAEFSLDVRVQIVGSGHHNAEGRKRLLVRALKLREALVRIRSRIVAQYP